MQVLIFVSGVMVMTKLVAIGVQDYEKIITSNSFDVDKTSFI